MKPQTQKIKEWSDAIGNILLRDRFYCQQKLRKIKERSKQNKPCDKIISDLEQCLSRSRKVIEARRLAHGAIHYPEHLPVSGKREEIMKLIEQHPVVVIAGETGSGKTTQIPKMLLEMGLGVSGQIAHTQPRRLAARSVAARIAEELGQDIGEAVGYKVRFNEQVKVHSKVKLMTDGILLNEIHNDKYLRQYDAIIIDEAHERSLNIDFLLGYLKHLLTRRDDLKVIITSATIDPEKFSRHFNKAPMIEVSGRTYPVDVLYSHQDDEHPLDLNEQIIRAMDELGAYNDGDTLVFLSGEREIKEAEKQLKKHLQHTEVLPLFSRLTQQEQNKIFHPGPRKRVILSTNVAETSLTVPRIKNVIDTGFARISRYSYRNKIQRLPVEEVSQASANQRKGRCGRLEDGICYRLYSEANFRERAAFTDPEILRTNLASVILQMAFLNLGDIEAFPFIDPPDGKSIRDGKRLLKELGALDGEESITAIGRQLARFPIDPRLARMIIEAGQRSALAEVLIICSALSIQDIRERPLGKEQEADESHQRFNDKTSDFVSYLKLWDYLSGLQSTLSMNQMRKRCKQEFLSFLRWREWHELYQQLKGLTGELKYKLNTTAADPVAIQQSLLSGLLSHIAELTPDGDYRGARNIRFHIFPGSAQFKRKHAWVVCAEIVETSKLYGRIVSKIEPHWLLDIAGHMVKKSYLEPQWSKKQGRVVAREIQTLFGLVISADKWVNFGDIEPVVARELFIRDALIAGQIRQKFDFLEKNKAKVADIEHIENKTRRRDLLIDEGVIYDFYHERLPAEVNCTAALQKCLQRAPMLEQQLLVDKQFLMRQRVHHDVDQQFPQDLALKNAVFPLHYCFEPGHAEDGVSVELPVSVLNQFENADFERLVPGLLEDKIVALMRSLPKSLRKNFVPVPDYARACFDRLQDTPGDMLATISRLLYEQSGVKVRSDEWRIHDIDEHFLMNFIVVDNEGKRLAQGRDLERLQAQLKSKIEDSVYEISDDFNRVALKDWTFGDLKKEHVQELGGHRVVSYPALSFKSGAVNLTLMDDPVKSECHSRYGIRRLMMLQLEKELHYLAKNIPQFKSLALAGAHIMTKSQLQSSILEAAVRDAMPNEWTGDEKQFREALACCRGNLISCGNRVAEQLAEVFKLAKRVQKEADKISNLANIASIQDMAYQLGSLFFDGFIHIIDKERLSHYIRYLKAMEKRLERLELNPVKDIQQVPGLESWKEKLDHLVQANPERLYWPDDWWRFRWMVEEYRISLFAQGIKTEFPVSEKRLVKAWKELDV